MVKRAIAIVVGVTVGALVCFIFGLAVYERPVETNAEACLRGPLVDCVGYEPPVQARLPDAPLVEAAAPCKSWLGADGAGSIKLLSQCLHDARQDTRRRRSIATSS